ncbi:MAG: glycoside hydrolase 43 family protein [Bacteroidota bacterium]
MKFLLILFFFTATICQAQKKQQVTSKTWVADNGDGTYRNPVLHADYSDPDAIRVGDDFYMVSSSFEDIPGLPILHSKDLVNWQIITHALKRQPPFDYYTATQHGAGVWAPAIRYHQGEFYIYYPDPDFGIYLVKAPKAGGPWTEPVLVEAGKGLIDPCPLWDEDGKAYLVHGYAGSRAGIKSIIVVKQMNAAGSKIIDAGKLVYDGHNLDPTIEGPKFYKRNGWYYIFAPAGGVSTGWQLVLRSKNVYGPYERRVVMDQGSGPINGPHQGAWVSTQTGEDWFLHFQDKGAYGRVVHLQPMKWKNDWPVIGMVSANAQKGEPVLTYKKPKTGLKNPIVTPAESDEFNGVELGLQWQWMGNPKATWSFLNTGTGALRLFSDKLDSIPNLWFAPNLLLQKFPAETFIATTLVNFSPNTKLVGEKAGITVMGMSYAALYLKRNKDGIDLVFGEGKNADAGQPETETVISQSASSKIYLRVTVDTGGICRFSYSLDGESFKPAGTDFTAVVGKWKGAKTGIFCVRDASVTNDAGYADFDWFRVEKNMAGNR